MNAETLLKAQSYLTVKDGISERKIVDITALSINHDADEILLFLCALYHDKHRLVSRLLESDNNSIVLDIGIGAMFRLTQAIRLIKDSRKEDDNEQFEQYYTTRSDEDIMRAKKKIMQVADGISKNVFIPNDGHWKCKGCSFAEHCRNWFKEVA
jgi:hypothetical protein